MDCQDAARTTTRARGAATRRASQRPGTRRSAALMAGGAPRRPGPRPGARRRRAGAGRRPPRRGRRGGWPEGLQMLLRHIELGDLEGDKYSSLVYRVFRCQNELSIEHLFAAGFRVTIYCLYKAVLFQDSGTLRRMIERELMIPGTPSPRLVTIYNHPFILLDDAKWLYSKGLCDVDLEAITLESVVINGKVQVWSRTH